ncbi:MAG: nucleotidyltransferase domain-containing protein [Bacteroidota bacterium]
MTVENSTRSKILARLRDIEAQRGIRILMAIESGSRAWGIASPDSDFDVRFIFTHPVERYLSVREPFDTINLPIDADLIDLSAWELRKTLNLIAKSNASPIEWTQSPIVYQEQDGFIEALNQLTTHYFQPRACAHHYLGLAQKTWLGELQKPEFGIKKYFYALRPLFAAMWIVERQEKPALTFADLRTVVEDAYVQEALDELLAAKEKAVEAEPIRPIAILHDYIQRLHFATTTRAAGLAKGQHDIERADQFFRQWLRN